MRFASFLSGGFTAMAVINQPERKLAKRISVQSNVMSLVERIVGGQFRCTAVSSYIGAREGI